MTRDWGTTLASVAPKIRAALVQSSALEILDALPEGETLGTMELVERLWPETTVRGKDELHLRHFVPTYILQMRERYPGVYEPGETVERFGRKLTRARWKRGPHALPVVPERQLTFKDRVVELEKRVANLEAILQGVLDAKKHDN